MQLLSLKFIKNTRFSIGIFVWINIEGEKKPRWSDQIVNLAFIVGLSLTCAPYTFCLRSPLTVHNRSQNSLQRSDNFQSQFCSSFAHHSISVHSRVCGCRLFRDFKWLISKYSTFPYMRLENFYYLFFTAVKDSLIYQ